MVRGVPGDERERLLDPVDRISEILFGLIMAVTIVGSLAVATAGGSEMRQVSAAALGCNLAWGMVDAIMYLVRTATERARNRALAERIKDADVATANRLILAALPEHVTHMIGEAEIERMRQRLLTVSFAGHGILRGRDWIEALGIFLLVVIATFPVVVPFFVVSNAVSALRMSQAITVVMLFVAGFLLGRHAGYRRPLVAGLAMAVIGVAVIAAVKALGG
jgi:VIT1/CCC1 family predicted Fe2+/Mn2+ transporter